MNKLKFIQNLSINNKIVAIILMVTILILSLGFSFIGLWDINRLKSEIQSDLVLDAKLVGDNCVVPLTFDDKGQATEVLSRLQYFDFIEIGCLYDKSGNIFATYPDTLSENSFLVLTEQQHSILKNRYFYVQEPVFFENEMYGTLLIKANSNTVSALMINLSIILSLLTLALVFLSLILASWMQRYISSPILKLKKHFDEISENQDFTAQLVKQNNDEVGSLYDGFNNMLNHINRGQQERDMAEDALRESEAKYRRVSDNSPAVLYQFMMTPDGEISFPYVSDMVQAVLGISPDEVMKDPSKFLSMVYPEDLEIFNKSIKESAESLESFPITFRCMKDGDVIWIWARGTPTPIPEGGILWDGFLLDITDQKLAELELEKHKGKLEELVKERTQDLEDKYKELENMNDVFVNREYRIKELKDRLEKFEQN